MTTLQTATHPSGSAGAGLAIVVRGLRVTLTGRPIHVVSDVNFDLRPGEILGLVGESGSGKTTVALALLGYSRPGMMIVDGSVVIDGVNILAADRELLQAMRGGRISYVPQDPASSLNPSLCIRTQLREILERHEFGSDRGERDLRLREVLDEVKLPSDNEFLSRYPHQLSGGQQQRVALAMAFACRPAVVVLDEPTTGLDVTTQAHVLDTVNELATEHRTAAVYVSHDLAVVAGLSARIAVMYTGLFMEVGPSGKLVHDAAHPYTRRLIEAAPDPERRRQLLGIPGRVAPLGQRKPGCVFADRCDFAKDECRVGEIAIEEVASGHAVRCSRWRDVRSAPRVVAEAIAPRSNGTDPVPAIEVRDLVASYGANRVLHGASLSIAAGRCLALVGESGSGKTTLARCISGMHTDVQGELRLRGDALPWSAAKRTPDVRRLIQYIFQSPHGSLNPRKSIRQLVEQPIKHFGLGDSDDKVPGLLERVSLSSRFARRYPSQLSGGECQRVAIARALAVSPEVLICDEITSALDVSVQASILQLLAELHDQTDLTVLFVTHNLGVVRAIADRVVVLDRGVIIEEGPVDRVLDAPAEPYTKSLLKDTPRFEQAARTENVTRDLA